MAVLPLAIPFIASRNPVEQFSLTRERVPRDRSPIRSNSRSPTDHFRPGANTSRGFSCRCGTRKHDRCCLITFSIIALLTAVNPTQAPQCDADLSGTQEIVWEEYRSFPLRRRESFPSSHGVMMNDNMNEVLRGNTLSSKTEICGVKRSEPSMLHAQSHPSPGG